MLKGLEVPPVLNQANLVFFPKEGKDPLNVQNYRPILLLNGDVKILAKIMLNRVNTISRLIHKDQVGFIPNRQASDNFKRHGGPSRLEFSLGRQDQGCSSLMDPRDRRLDGTLAVDNGLLMTPPMGWLSWERFRCKVECDLDPENCISEHLFMDMADRLVEDGWRQLGYMYVNMDDCWMARERDQQGRLVADPERFPSGIKALSDYIHSRGLKLGIYADLGQRTCAGFPGTTLDKIELDAATFAEWGVDMLKLDGCHSSPEEQAQGYVRMSQALLATGHQIAFSCSWPAYRGGLPPQVDYSLLTRICNMWRNYDDIEDSWNRVTKIIDWFFDHQDVLQPVAGPGHWNDPDMLVIGNFGLSFEESKSHMAIWAILAAPLLMSNDLRALSMNHRMILQNKLLIKINQDPLGIQGRRVLRDPMMIDIFVRRLTPSAHALVFFSRRVDRTIVYESCLIRFNFPNNTIYQAEDVYSGEIMRGLHAETNFTILVVPSGVVVWYVTPMV
ncbi:alpha-N-acetylgalactosaminidase [Discoglossus pictus]